MDMERFNNDHQIHLSLGSSILTRTPPRVYPFREIIRRLISFVNDPGILLADIVLFGFFLSRVSPQDFKTSLPREGFHTLKNDVLFSSPINIGHHG